MDPQLYFTFKRDNTFDTSKNILPFPCMEMFSWFKCIKNHLRITIYLAIHLSLNRPAKFLPWATLSSIFPHDPTDFQMKQDNSYMHKLFGFRFSQTLKTFLVFIKVEASSEETYMQWDCKSWCSLTKESTFLNISLPVVCLVVDGKQEIVPHSPQSHGITPTPWTVDDSTQTSTTDYFFKIKLDVIYW